MVATILLFQLLNITKTALFSIFHSQTMALELMRSTYPAYLKGFIGLIQAVHARKVEQAWAWQL